MRAEHSWTSTNESGEHCLALVCPAVDVHIPLQPDVRPEVEVVEAEEQPGLAVLLHPDPHHLVPPVLTRGTLGDGHQH